MDEDKVISVFLCSCAVCFIFGLCMGGCIKNSAMKQEAIEHKAAHYNPTNAVFEWNEK